MKYNRSVFNRIFAIELNNYDLFTNIQKNELEDLYSISKYYAFNSSIYNILINNYSHYTSSFYIKSLSEQANIIDNYWEKHKNNCFFNHTFIDAIKLIKRTYFIYGDVFIINTKSGNLPFYYIIDPIRIATPKIKDDKELQSRIYFGIEFNEKYDDILAYYIFKEFPEKMYNKYYISQALFDIDKFQRLTKSNVIATHNKLFPEQVRGIPLLTPVFETLARIERLLKVDMDYFEAINSLILALKTDRALKSLEALKKYSFNNKLDNSEEAININELNVKSPSIIMGSDYPQLLSENRNSTANMNALQFYIGQLTAFLNIPNFMITGDFSKVNFSSGRLAIKLFIQFCKNEIIRDIQNIYSQIYKNFINSLVINKIIEDKEDIYNFKVNLDFLTYDDTKLLAEMIKSDMIDTEDLNTEIKYNYIRE